MSTRRTLRSSAMAPGGAMLMHQALSQLMQHTLPEHDVHCTVLLTPAAGLVPTGPGPARRTMACEGHGRRRPMGRCP